MTPLLIATGAESSGTRMLGRILATSGLPVLHLSLPHGETWWEPGMIEHIVRACGHEPRWVVIHRLHGQAESAVRRGHARTLEEAREKGLRADEVLFWSPVAPGAVWTWYETWLRAPSAELAYVSERLSLPLSIPPDDLAAMQRRREQAA